MVPYASPDKNDQFVFPKNAYGLLYAIIKQSLSQLKLGFHFGDRKKSWVLPSGRKEDLTVFVEGVSK